MMLTNKNFGLFDELFKDPFFSTTFNRSDTSLMKTDIQESGDKYLLDIELPGFHKEDIHAELKEGYLTVTATRNEKKDDKDEKGNYLRRERFSGTCKRSFYVGEGITQDDIQAGFENGILRLSIPKEAPKAIEEKPKYITIQ